MTEYDFGQLPGFHDTLRQDICQWFQDEENWCHWANLREQVEHV